MTATTTTGERKRAATPRSARGDASMPAVTARTPSPTALAPLRVAGFKVLAGSYSVNELGNWLGDIALAVLVFTRTGSALATALLFVGARFVPAALAPLLVARVEPAPSRVSLPLLYGADAASFALVAVALALSRSLPAGERGEGDWTRRLRAGFVYVRARKLLLTLITAQALLSLFFFAVVPIEVVYVKQTLGAANSGY